MEWQPAEDDCNGGYIPLQKGDGQGGKELQNPVNKFSQGIAAIEAIPEEERGFLLTLWLGRLYSNLAVLGDYDQRVFTDSRERVYQQERDERLMRKAIDILLTVQKEGERDPP